MRETVALSLAKHVGSVLTIEDATAIAREICKQRSPCIELQRHPCTVEEMRAKILKLEAEVLKLPQVDLNLTHRFSDGIYAREITIPAGSVIVGKVHLFTNLNILSRGDLTLLTEDGVRRVQGGFTVVSPPGTKRVAYAHEDSIWTTILATNETDVEKLEKHFVVDSIDEYLAICASPERIEGG